MSTLDFGNDHPVIGLYPVANAFAGTVYSTVVNMANAARAEFTIIKGVGATGTATITMEACDDKSGTNPVAIPFYYQPYIGADDVPTAVVAATAAGFTTTAGSNQRYEIQVDAQRMGNKGWLRLKSVEVAASAVLGMIDIELEGLRQATEIPVTAIA
jgi:hypothetical protein